MLTIRNRWRIAIGALVALLLLKFGLPLLRFELPLGYDPGIYRYLMIRYAEGWPPFTLPDLLPWAREHSMGMFLFTTPLLKLGIPADWLIGWVWNAFCVLLLCVLAWVIGRREGRAAGVLVLLMGLLSQAYFDGFYAMYWKTYVALLFLVLCFDALERWSPLAAVWALLTLITHTQTGLILGLAIASWWIWQTPRLWREPRYRIWTAAFAGVVLVSLLFYLPNWQRAIDSPLRSIFLLRGDKAPGGSFPEAMFYLRVTGILLALGVGGLVVSLRRERGTLWQLAVLWCAVFILLRLVFYRRFFLQLDFFLLPFAAIALRDLWQRFCHPAVHGSLMFALLLQASVSFWLSLQVHPDIEPEIFAVVQEVAATPFPEAATLIALDNASAPWLLGWVPSRSVGGPGLFDVPDWTYTQWKTVLYGAPEERRLIMESLPTETYVVETPFFRQHYGTSVDAFLADPCLETVASHVHRVSCAGKSRLAPAP